MRLVHLSDLHLGFRQFYRTNKSGINLREADGARAFQEAVDKTIALAPDLVIIAGDVFHKAAPPNNAIVHAQRQLMRIRAALPATIIVIASGNHDQPRATDSGNILTLFESIGVHVAATAAKRITVPELELSILAVPDVCGNMAKVYPVLTPDASSRYNVLLMHGEVEYIAPAAPHPWDYVALGHYHVHREVAPRAYYAGAIDYTSSNPWGELAEEQASGIPGKGLIEYDLDLRVHVFHPLAPPRGFVDLPAIDATDKTPAEVDAAIRCALESCDGGIEDKVVRLTIRDIPRSVAKGLDHRALRTYKARALNFQLVLQKPADMIVVGGTARPIRKRMSLEEIVREAMSKRAVPSDIDRGALAELALKYLDAADAPESVIAEPQEQSTEEVAV